MEMGQGQELLKDLGIEVEGVEIEDSVREYLDRLRQGDERVRTHYGKMAIMCRVL